VLAILFSKVKSVVPLDKLKFHRPKDEELSGYREFAVRYFDCLATAFPELEEYFGSDNPEEVVRRHRHAEGGSVLFRPVGLVIFANLAAAAGKDRTLEEVVGLLARLPTDLSAEPYRDLLWNSAARTMDLRRQVLVRRLLLYVLGLIRGTNEIAKLKADVARVRGIEPNAVTLPEKVV
jgi:DNA sulfur modification protein DndB